jgi:2-dehydro-3-deoxygluconokinase
LVRAADIVFAGDDEATLVVPPHADPLELAEALAALGPRQALVKLGEDGTAAVIDGERYVQPAVSVPVADTVGAGDAVVAGYLADLIAGADPAQRLRAAVTAGAFACTVPSDWEGLPRRDELDLLDVAEGVIR